MERGKYTEAELVENRVAVLLSGGTAAERQAWAEETAGRLGSSATIVTAPESLRAALAQKDPGLQAALFEQAEFGKPGHALYTQAPGFDRQRAAEIFLKKVEESPYRR